MTDDPMNSITGEMSRISIFTFFSVAESLGLTEAEQRRFLEDPDDAEFADWRDHGAGVFSAVLFMKVNALVTLASFLNQRFEHQAGLGWLRRPNPSPPFAGRTPADIIAGADLAQLESVRQHLEG